MINLLLVYLILVHFVPGAFSQNSSRDGFVVSSRREVLDLSVESDCEYSGTIHLGAPNSLFQRDKYFAFGSKQLIAHHMIIDYVNQVRCGLKLQNKNYRVELQVYNDRSSVEGTFRVAKYLVNNNLTDIILGGYSSETAEALANVTSSAGRLLIAPGAATTSIFANRPKTFGTAPPSSKYAVEAIKAMAQVAGARSIATVYENLAFTQTICGAIPKLAQQYGLNVTSQYLVPESPNVSILEPIARNISKQNPDVVMTCTYDAGCQGWMQAMKNVGWSPKAQIFTVCVGLTSFAQAFGSELTYFFGVSPWDPSLNIVDPVTGWSPQEYADNFRLVTNVVDVPYQSASGAAAMSVALQSIEAVQSLDETSLASYIANASFKTVYGNVQFDFNGQNTAPILLLQYDANAKIQTVFPTSVSSGTLTYPMPTWDQRACKGNSTCKNQGNSCDDLGRCICGKPNEYAVESGASAMCIPKEDMNYVSVPILASLYAMVGVNFFLCCLATFWTFYYRANKLVHASQPLCLYLVICGALVSTLAILPLTYQTGYENSADIQLADAACMAVPWMWGLGFIIIFSSLFAKIWRVKKLFQSAAGFRKQQVGMRFVFYIVIGMGIIELAILIAFQIVSPLHWYREVLVHVKGHVIESQGYCTSQRGWSFFLALGAFNVICLLYAVILSFQTKDIPSIFAEGKHIFLAVMLMFQVLILSIPLSALVKNNPSNFCFILGVSIFLQNFTVLVAIFAPKMLIIYRGEDTDEAVKNAIAEGVARLSKTSNAPRRFRNDAEFSRPATGSNIATNDGELPFTSDVSASMRGDEFSKRFSASIKVDEPAERRFPSNLSSSIQLEDRQRATSETSDFVEEERRIPSKARVSFKGDPQLSKFSTASKESQ